MADGTVDLKAIEAERAIPEHTDHALPGWKRQPGRQRKRDANA